MYQKKNPYGISNFQLIVQENYLFFDKTDAIVKTEELGRYLKIWRPRRSGKSFFCNQLSLYYDKAEKGNKVFDNTFIGKHLTPCHSKYLVLFLSFGDVSATNDVKSNFRDYINRSIFKFSEKYRNILKADIKIDKMNHLSSMQNLFWAVEKVKEEIYLIVDEYDSFANRLLFSVDTTSSDLGYNQYRSEVAGKETLLRDFGNVIKGATSTVLGRIFITGVTPFAMADELSSLNMVEDISSYSCMESSFGYTEDEIKEALEQTCPSLDNQKDIDMHLKILRDNFNGYRYNKNQIKSVFNPQMCLYYLKQLEQTGKPPDPLLDPNIVTNSDNVAEYLARNYRGFSSTIGPLDLLCTFIGIPIKLQKSIDTFCTKQLFDKANVDSAILSLAFHHGYLTYGNPAEPAMNERLVCPNKVLQDTLLDAILKTNLDGVKRSLGLSGTSNEQKNKVLEALKGKMEDAFIDKFLDYFLTL